MNKFEQYLLSIGYLKMRYNHDTDKYEREKEDTHTISTIVNLHYWYVWNEDIEVLNNPKKNPTKRMIKFGLNECGKPPTLIYPHLYQRNGGYLTQLNDDMVNRLLKKHTSEEFYFIITALDYIDGKLLGL